MPHISSYNGTLLLTKDKTLQIPKKFTNLKNPKGCDNER